MSNLINETRGRIDGIRTTGQVPKAEDLLRGLEEACEILTGFAAAARRLGLSDTYGLLRANIVDEDSLEARQILAALDLLEELGVSTEEPDLSTLLKQDAA